MGQRERDELFASYKAIRAFVERQIWQIRSLVGHVGLFVVFVVLLMLQGTDFAKTKFPLPQYGGAMTLYSVVILSYTVAALLQSSFMAAIRGRRIHKALLEVLQGQKTDLVSNNDQLLAVEAILNADIRERAGIFLPWAIYGVINALIFLSWYPLGGTSLHWQMTILFAILILIPSALLNFVRRMQRDKAIPMRLPLSERQKAAQVSPERLAEWEANPLNLDHVYVEKKSKTPPHPTPEELVDYFESLFQQKKKNDET